MEIVSVLPPAPPTNPPELPDKHPTALSVNTPAIHNNNSGDAMTQQNGRARNDNAVIINGIDEEDPSKPPTPSFSAEAALPVKPVFKTPKTPRTPLTPLSPEARLEPDDYRYVVKDTNSAGSDELRMVSAVELSRPKGVFSTAKLKLLLRSVLYRKSDRHPFAVKVI